MTKLKAVIIESFGQGEIPLEDEYVIESLRQLNQRGIYP